MRAWTWAAFALALSGCASTTVYVSESKPWCPPDFWYDADWWQRNYELGYLWPQYHGDKQAFARHMQSDPAWRMMSPVARRDVVDALE